MICKCKLLYLHFQLGVLINNLITQYRSNEIWDSLLSIILMICLQEFLLKLKRCKNNKFKRRKHNKFKEHMDSKFKRHKYNR